MNTDKWSTSKSTKVYLTCLLLRRMAASHADNSQTEESKA